MGKGGREQKDKKLNNIVISTETFAEYDKRPVDMLRRKGFGVILNPYRRRLKTEELIDLSKGAVGLIAGVEPITEEVFKRLPGLKVISRCGAGIDNIDLEAAKRSGVTVLNTPDAPTLPVAELTIGLILALLRRIIAMDKDMRAGAWTQQMGELLSGKTVGIMGFGRIGKKVAQFLRPFRCDVVFYDPNVRSGAHGARRVSLEALLGKSDILTLHFSGGSTVLGKKEISLMKKGAFLINTSRGHLIDERGLLEALKKKRLSAAAIDVFENEPYSGALRRLDNVILTPHIGSYARSARIEMETQAAGNLLAGLGRRRCI
jgi:D-3-phosphoglycerate dehydrogenase